jgi:hypothetical protein
MEFGKGNAMRKTARASWGSLVLAGAVLAVGLLLEGCQPPVSPTGSPAMRVMQGAASYASGDEYVFSQGVIADGDGGICADDVVFTIQNGGAGDLVISSVQFTSGSTADFDLAAAGGAVTVAPASSTTFTVCLDPVAAGPQTSVVATISSNDSAAGAFTLLLRGFGMKGRLAAAGGGSAHVCDP